MLSNWDNSVVTQLTIEHSPDSHSNSNNIENAVYHIEYESDNDIQSDDDLAT